MRAIVMLLMASAVVFAQAPTESLRFEVVSIKLIDRLERPSDN